ncbi:hypothetical protein [uncultured Tateyamaria sp.]|uniref:hypothetical protein n=1 Tax=uncultured Tateyamaria sp. TaxID=455651 RepID=UPI002601EBDB|nr:hypothetical protein [uncultured Tateyamaria sp.]
MFELKGKGHVLQLTEVLGHPRKGITLSVVGQRCRVVEVGRNSTDGQAVSTRSCLTGKPVAPYGHVLVKWISEAPLASDIHGNWVEEEIH